MDPVNDFKLGISETPILKDKRYFNNSGKGYDFPKREDTQGKCGTSAKELIVLFKNAKIKKVDYWPNSSHGLIVDKSVTEKATSNTSS